MSTYYSRNFEKLLTRANTGVERESHNQLPVIPRNKMDSDRFKKLNELRIQKAAQKKMKNKSIGKALVQSRKQAQEHATENPSTRTKLCTFLFKRESKCLPSQVPKADTHRSPLKLSRSTRNLITCGYSSQSQAYVHPAD